MAVFYNIDSLPQFANAVVTIGTFDGVHAGHRQILAEVVKYAHECSGESILITFEPHPRKVLFPHQSLGLLTSLSHKLQLVASTGITHTVVVPFTPAFAALSAEEYVAEFLVNRFHPKSVVIGYDHRFGNARNGGIDLLRKVSPQYGFDVVEIPAQLIADAAVSSTKIRNAISQGKVTEAAQMLGRNYTIEGRVEHGRQLGRQLGYPTANLSLLMPEQVVPQIGVYAVLVEVDYAIYGGMMSIGLNPTVSDTADVKLEVNIFNFDADIYGADIRVHFVARMRPEQKFDSLTLLVDQLHADKETALALLVQYQ